MDFYCKDFLRHKENISYLELDSDHRLPSRFVELGTKKMILLNLNKLLQNKFSPKKWLDTTLKGVKGIILNMGITKHSYFLHSNIKTGEQNYEDACAIIDYDRGVFTPVNYDPNPKVGFYFGHEIPLHYYAKFIKNRMGNSINHTTQFKNKKKEEEILKEFSEHIEMVFGKYKM